MAFIITIILINLVILKEKKFIGLKYYARGLKLILEYFLTKPYIILEDKDLKKFNLEDFLKTKISNYKYFSIIIHYNKISSIFFRRM